VKYPKQPDLKAFWNLNRRTILKSQAILSSYVDAEKNFISRAERYASAGCSVGKNGSNCSGSQGFKTVVYNNTVLPEIIEGVAFKDGIKQEKHAA